MFTILETPRLYLRELLDSDYPDLCAILQDPDVMYAYEHAFQDTEVRQWLANQLRRYREDGFGLWAVIEKQSQRMIGQSGLTMQDCNGHPALEVGYLFQKAYWHQGYATEAAHACRDYAFEALSAQEVCSIIRDTNLPSQHVAQRNGMTKRGHMTKFYYQMEMLLFIYTIRQQEWQRRKAEPQNTLHDGSETLEDTFI